MKFRINRYVLLLAAVLMSCSPDNESVDTTDYVLPYPVGETYAVIQGYGGSFSHTGKFHYAIDFEMDIGSGVTAARDGTVVQIEESFIDANRTPGQENYVIIQHKDGSFARYFHLTKDGALVGAGDKVVKGQAIGLSGDTGFSTLPHLHFDVTTGCALPAPDCQTIGIEFMNATDPIPEGGVAYEALVY